MTNITNDDIRRISATSSRHDVGKFIGAAKRDHLKNSQPVYTHAAMMEFLEEDCVKIPVSLRLVAKSYSRSMRKKSDRAEDNVIDSPMVQANLETLSDDLLAFNEKVGMIKSECEKLTDYIEEEVFPSSYDLRKRLCSILGTLTGDSQEKCSRRIERKSARIVAPPLQLRVIGARSATVSRAGTGKMS